MSSRILKGRKFARFARKAHISDADLWEAIQRANAGLIDADLGGGVIKQRIARSGEGKSGGSRSIILFRRGDCAVFVHGFEKKTTSNITVTELFAFRRLADRILNYSVAEMEEQIETGSLIEIEEPKED
jgi:hypothetical protein